MITSKVPWIILFSHSSSMGSRLQGHSRFDIKFPKGNPLSYNGDVLNTFASCIGSPVKIDRKSRYPWFLRA